MSNNYPISTIHFVVGPDKTVKAARPAFDDLCKSITVQRR